MMLWFTQLGFGLRLKINNQDGKANIIVIHVCLGILFILTWPLLWPLFISEVVFKGGYRLEYGKINTVVLPTFSPEIWN
jgi:hypothetical protein